jgi:hypothetical protein
MTPELEQALRNLRSAVEFQDQCRADLENAVMTGATRDAREWIDTAAREMVAALPPGF